MTVFLEALKTRFFEFFFDQGSCHEEPHDISASLYQRFIQAQELYGNNASAPKKRNKK